MGTAVFPTGICVSRLGWGREMVIASSFVLGEDSQDFYASSAHSEISKQTSLPYRPSIFKTVASMLYLNGPLCCAVSLKAGAQLHIILSALPEPTQLI